MCRRALVLSFLPLLFAVLPADLQAVLNIEELHHSPASFDERPGAVAPSPEALGLAASYGGKTSWNRFGTVRLMFDPDGFLDTGLAGDPATAAREWIRQNRALFALTEASVDTLELVRDSNLEGSSARVLLFGQMAGGVPVMNEGRIKIGVVDGNLFWVASSSIGEPGTLAPHALTPEAAWLAAAADLGLGVGVSDVLSSSIDGDWTALEVAGLSHPQRVRPVALGVPGAGAVPAWETLTIDLEDGELVGYTHFVDAVSGDALVGKNLVRQLFQPDEKTAGLPVKIGAFAGEYPPGQVGDCGPCHGPFTAEPDESWDQLVIVAHHLAGGDITFNVYRDAPGCDANLVTAQDFLTTPEQATIQPVETGDYYVEVCPFDPTTNLVSGHHAGTVTFQSDLSPNANPKWRFFPAYPPLDFASIDTRTLGCWFDEDASGVFLPECELELAAGSSHGITWDYLPETGTPSETTTGNAARSSEARGAFISGGGPYQPVVASADPADHRVYDFPWTNQWFESACDPATLTLSGGVLPDADIDAAITNLFALHNQVHDWAYHLGYRERQGAAQLDNFGQTQATAENDFELGNAQAGALTGGYPSYTGRDNANQLPTPDGVPPLTNMYLWQTVGGAIYVPCVDGDFDGGIIAHEYGHLVQHRMVDPQNGLGGDLGRAMGESWSDLTAIALLNQYGRVPVAGENPFAVGAYITDPETGIRNFAMNDSPLNHGNVGYDFVCNTSLLDVSGSCLSESQVHADGEIWSATNFELRQALLAKHDAQYPSSDAALQARCADGQMPPDRCPGNRRWSQILHDAFLLMPNAPTMVDARDAYLAADLMRANDPILDWPSNAAEMWEVFARRGLGQNASATDGDDWDPVPDFSSPAHANATVTFVLVSDETKAPVAGEIFVGQFESRSTPVADTDASTALDDVHAFVPGTYDFVARADGYGHHRFQATFGAGQARTVKVHMPTNWASASQGATVAGAGSDHAELNDDTEETNWERVGAVPSVDVERPAVTVTFAGVHRINRVQVGGMLEVHEGVPLQSRFTSVHGFRVLACNAAVTNCSVDANYSEILNAPDAFPSRDLRPLVGDVTVRSFDTTEVDATHLRLEVLHNKCTGTPKYQGYLGIPGNEDGDPNNLTDCRTGVPGAISAKNDAVRVAELQAFGREGRVQNRKALAIPGEATAAPTE